MKICKILKSFLGSPSGNTVVQYTEGEVVELTDYLYAAVKNTDQVEEVKEKKPAQKTSAKKRSRTKAKG